MTQQLTKKKGTQGNVVEKKKAETRTPKDIPSRKDRYATAIYK